MTVKATILKRLLQGVTATAALSLASAEAPKAKVPRPPGSELIRIVGQPLSSGFKKVKWETGLPPAMDVPIYEVEPARYDEEFLKELAEALGVKGTPVRMPPDFGEAPGYWIKEPNPTNHLRFKSVFFSEVAGRVGYASGEDNHRWDLKNHRPLAFGVPSAEEALQKTLALLPALRLSTNDLEHTPAGALRWTSDNEGTSYTDRSDGKRKRYVRQMNVTLWQRMLAGGSTIGVGGGGAFRAGFMSDGKLAELELLFRRVTPLHMIKPKTKTEVISSLRKGMGHTFYENVPEAITVTNCALVYPQGNITCRQSHLWPFYSIKGFGVENGGTNGVIVYVPIAW